jgi:hypothetical protein
MKDPYAKLDRELNIAESEDSGLSVVVVAIGAACLAALLWLGGAF